jgi:hypothetical protein
MDTTALIGRSGIIDPVIGEIVDERQLAEQRTKDPILHILIYEVSVLGLLSSPVYR